MVSEQDEVKIFDNKISFIIWSMHHEKNFQKLKKQILDLWKNDLKSSFIWDEDVL